MAEAERSTEESGPGRTRVAVAGTPEEIGATWGRVNGEAIRLDLEEHFVRPASAAGIDASELAAQSECFAHIAGDLAPHWLDEMAAVARAADVDPGLYLSYVANVHRQLFLHPECTSYAVSRAFTRDAVILFHKNRDNVERPQAACVVASSLPGIQHYVTVSDASVPACMMMVNGSGLAGSADTGGLPVGRPRFRGLMNTFILRHIAERATCCAAALAILQDLVGKGLYAGGHSTGTHWLFVDREGRILEVSHNSDEIECAWHEEKLYMSARADSAAAQRLREAPEPVDFAFFHSVSRDPSICFDTSISGMTVAIDPGHPDMLTSAWIALPARSLGLPVFVGQQHTPAALFDGTLYAAGRDLPPRSALWDDVEAGTRASLEAVREPARGLLSTGQADRAAELLEAWSAAQARAGLALLRPLG